MQHIHPDEKKPRGSTTRRAFPQDNGHLRRRPRLSTGTSGGRLRSTTPRHGQDPPNPPAKPGHVARCPSKPRWRTPAHHATDLPVEPGQWGVAAQSGARTAAGTGSRGDPSAGGWRRKVRRPVPVRRARRRLARGARLAPHRRSAVCRGRRRSLPVRLPGRSTSGLGTSGHCPPPTTDCRSCRRGHVGMTRDGGEPVAGLEFLTWRLSPPKIA